MTKPMLASLIALLFTFALNLPAQAGPETKIEDGAKVTLHYKITIDGQLVDDTHDREPLMIQFGETPIIPGIANGIKGLKAGDKKTITIAPEDAFGPVNPQALVEVPKERLKREDLQPGMMFTVPSETGEPMHAMVKEIREETVIMDFNHPFAGQVLTVDVEILDVV